MWTTHALFFPPFSSVNSECSQARCVQTTRCARTGRLFQPGVWFRGICCFSGFHALPLYDPRLRPGALALRWCIWTDPTYTRVTHNISETRRGGEAAEAHRPAPEVRSGRQAAPRCRCGLGPSSLSSRLFALFARTRAVSGKTGAAHWRMHTFFKSCFGRVWRRSSTGWRGGCSVMSA